MFESKHCESQTGLELRWLSWRSHAAQICSLRHAAQVAPIGADAADLQSRDQAGVHLGAYAGGRLVAVGSAHLLQDAPQELAARGLPSGLRAVAHFFGLAAAEPGQLPEVDAVLLGCLQFMVLSLLRPDGVFLTVGGDDGQLAARLAEALKLEAISGAAEALRSGLILGAQGTEPVRRCLLAARQQCHQASQQLAVTLPSLARHLEQEGRLGLVDIDSFATENLYTQPLSLKDELPRLAAQTRIVLPEQRVRLACVQFPPGPAQFLDLGAGPGVYIAALSKEPMFQGYEFTALDLAPEMVLFGKMNRAKFRWLQASAYATGEPSGRYDVVQGVFLFVHLMSPDLALREIARILKPGGLLYILDVNDSTFQGPAIIADMIDFHASIYEGDRKVLNLLPGLAAQHGLQLTHQFSSELTNRAPGAEPVYTPGRIDLSRAALWGMASLLGQRKEMREKFEAAQSHYFSTDCDFSIALQTHVYRKP